jgi:hypothetical protein
MLMKEIGAGAGFEPDCDLVWSRSPFEPPLKEFFEFHGKKGLGFPKGITG